MKLTVEQIAYIEKYIKKTNIKYYEVYMEILDHMILSVEAILEEDTSIEFEKAVVKAKVEGFGKKGFKTLSMEREQLLNKLNRDNYFSYIVNFFDTILKSV